MIWVLFGKEQNNQLWKTKEKKNKNLINKINKNISKQDIEKSIEESLSNSTDNKKKNLNLMHMKNIIILKMFFILLMIYLF